MIVTVFRSRLRTDSADEYQTVAARMNELVRSMPGYLSHKTFTADDGERVTLVEFVDESGHRGWSTHPEHVQAKDRGRASFYAEYRVQVCNVIREVRFPEAG
ncbi:MAG: antibiotic biosynthesis monooxygenase [Chromatiaceae bacterium]|nr:antibiotic biosynthesis monooxygenase [Chromatiaceae bacterium]